MRDRRAKEPWRVGVLFSRSGVTAITEESQLCGTLLAIEEINSAGGVSDREIVPIIYDPASEPSLYAHFAKKLLIEDGVSTIFGCYTTPSRKAVLPLVERQNGLLWYPTLYEGFEYSPNVIYTGAAPNQNSVELADFLVGCYGSRFYFLGSNYLYPRESNRIMRRILRRHGASIVAERYIELRAGPADLKSIIRDIRKVNPDIIFSTVIGKATVYLYQAYADAGFDPEAMPIASLTTSEAEIRAMGADVGRGHITVAPYFQAIAGEHNSAFVSRYKRRFGDAEPTNMSAEAAYFQVHVFAAALAEAETLETEVLRSLVLGAEFDAPQGPISINAHNGHTDLWMRIGKADERGQFRLLRESKMAVHPDPYFASFGLH